MMELVVNRTSSSFACSIVHCSWVIFVVPVYFNWSSKKFVCLSVRTWVLRAICLRLTLKAKKRRGKICPLTEKIAEKYHSEEDEGGGGGGGSAKSYHVW